MNALGGTPFSQALGTWGSALPRPKGILAVSAHWQTPELRITASPRPPTVHDFSGFPSALEAIEYPVAGDPDLARRVVSLLERAGLPVGLDRERGLDHGAWAPLQFLFPEADVPVVQISLLALAAGARHVEAGQALAPLRDEGILIVASGNLTHNLRSADLSHRDLPVASWAASFDRWVVDKLLERDLAALALLETPEGRQAHPTLEHYAPFLVAVGAALPFMAVAFPFEGFEHGTLSMRCVQFD